MPLKCWPQWSPPINGGMTLGRAAGHVVAYPAAMEPADQRRDDWEQAVVNGVAKDGPQWSPPINGGMTPPRQARRRAPVRAAMEPADQRRDD